MKKWRRGGGGQDDSADLRKMCQGRKHNIRYTRFAQVYFLQEILSNVMKKFAKSVKNLNRIILKIMDTDTKCAKIGNHLQKAMFSFCNIYSRLQITEVKVLQQGPPFIHSLSLCSKI